jgi:8-oxo-dGTP diphosphatase
METDMKFKYRYPRPALTVDCVVFGLDDKDLKVLLIQRARKPFRGRWALPGGFVGVEEPLDEAARRELQEETGLRNVYLEQLYTFGEPDRDPRERVVTVTYYALVNLRDHQVRAATDAREAAWFAAPDVPALAFDHEKIIEAAIARLKERVRNQPIGFELLPPKFTLTQLQRLYEKVLGRPLDKRNFRKKIQSMDFLEALDEIQRDVSHRAARLYRFDKRKYGQAVAKGFSFEI